MLVRLLLAMLSQTREARASFARMPIQGAVWGIVLAAGSGTRFGGPKHEAILAGRQVAHHSVESALQVCDEVVVVLPAGGFWDGPEVAQVVTGGALRMDSVAAALAVVPVDVAIVVIHDAARPLASRDLFDAVIGAVRAGAVGAIPGTPVVDALKFVDRDKRDQDENLGQAGGQGPTRVTGSLCRDDLMAVQTPQAFRAEVLREAHYAANRDALGHEAADDAELVGALGTPLDSVVIVPGEAANLKITTPTDLLVAEVLICDRGIS